MISFVKSLLFDLGAYEPLIGQILARLIGIHFGPFPCGRSIEVINVKHASQIVNAGFPKCRQVTLTTHMSCIAAMQNNSGADLIAATIRRCIVG